jgi:hypothetical protein
MMTPEGESGELESLRHQLHVVTEVSNQLATRLFALESRLAQVERGLAIPMAPAVAQHLGIPTGPPPPLPPPPPIDPAFATPPPLPDGPPPLPPQAQYPAPPFPPPSRGKIETQVGLTWINRIGVITLIIGVAFAFKYLVDNDYIGASGRVIIGVLAGAITLYAGDLLWHRGQRVFAQGLTGLGVSILYLSFYAAFDYYHLIPQAAALVLMLATIACGGALALRYNARAIALLSLFGGYATPIMLSSGTPDDTFFAVYMILLNGVALWAARQRKWRIVEVIALAATVCLEGAWLADRGGRMGLPIVIGSTLVQYAMFATGSMWAVAAVAHVSACLAVGSYYWNPIIQVLLEVAGLGIFYWRKWVAGPPVVFLGWWLAYAISVSSYRFGDPLAHHAFLYSSIAFVILLAYPVWLSAARRELPGTAALSTMAINGVIYFGVAHDLLAHKYADYMGLFAVAVATLYLAAGWLIWISQPAEKRDSQTPTLAAGMALAFISLAVPIQFTGYRVAIAWAIQSAALAFIGSRLRSWRVSIGAAVVAILALGDLPVGLEYAQPDYRPVLNSDFVTFAVVAVSLWVMAYFISKTPGVAEWAAGPPYVIGHVVFLTGLHYEIFQYLDWTKHGWNSKLLASTLLLAVYGLALLVIGIRTRTVINRVMALVLFAVVIFKLYLSDVWIFDVIFKMVAFLALGGLLVAGSYLYSRYRSRIETLWKKDDVLV